MHENIVWGETMARTESSHNAFTECHGHVNVCVRETPANYEFGYSFQSRRNSLRYLLLFLLKKKKKKEQQRAPKNSIFIVLSSVWFLAEAQCVCVNDANAKHE